MIKKCRVSILTNSN